MIKFTYKKKPKKNSPTLNTNAFFFIYQFQMYLLHHEMYQNTFESHPFQKKSTGSSNDGRSQLS